MNAKHDMNGIVGSHDILFLVLDALRFDVAEADNIIAGLRNEGYRTICIGGVGFFNEQTPLSQIFPNMFCEAHWKSSFGVTDPKSTERQFARAVDRIAASQEQPVFLFVNVSA